MHLSAQHLAELLIGIARAQAATVQGIDKVAHLRDLPEPTLVDLPIRILLTTLGARVGPDPAAIAKDLERLCTGAAPTGGPGGDLDFNAPPP
jgi:hypothetical protein